MQRPLHLERIEQQVLLRVWRRQPFAPMAHRVGIEPTYGFPLRLTAGCLASRLPVNAVNEEDGRRFLPIAGRRTAVGCGSRSRTRIFLVNSQAHYHAFACATPQCGTQIVKDRRELTFSFGGACGNRTHWALGAPGLQPGPPP